MHARLDWSAAATIASREFRDRLRNRWVLAVALVFAVFALAIAWFGMAQQGSVGYRGIDVTIVSLSSLVTYLVPLIALLLGYDAIVGERERGSLELLLSLPITHFELLLGKFAGLAAALAASTALGFGVALLALSNQLDARDAMHFLGFAGSAILLGLAFLSMSLCLSVLAHNRIRASGLAIGLWFLFVLVFDMVLMGVLVLSQGALDSSVFGALLMLNPADVFRLLNIFSSEQVQGLYGLATVMPEHMTSPGLLAGVMLAWIAVPFAIATWRFK
ncbi:ABC transporter permease [Pseudoduganella sp. S-14]|uniref:ABC transporter permease n=1 Tax=Pseudoduganella sp. S-14 TaxID=3404065 RepID=UPI003CE8FA83